MNIFVLHTDPAVCAKMHCDKHVVKMILESVQMLSTVGNENGFPGPYKSTHKNHPCTQWVAKSWNNFAWLYKLTYYLNEEFKYRYSGKDHLSWLKLTEKSMPDSIILGENGLTPFAQAMPEQYRDSNPVKAYRQYYLGEKENFATWTRREIPEWFSLGDPGC